MFQNIMFGIYVEFPGRMSNYVNMIYFEHRPAYFFRRTPTNSEDQVSVRANFELTIYGCS